MDFLLAEWLGVFTREYSFEAHTVLTVKYGVNSFRAVGGGAITVQMHTVEDPNRIYLARMNAHTNSWVYSVPGLTFGARAAATSHGRASN